MTNFVIGFVFGTFFGVGMVVLYGAYCLQKLKKTTSKLVEETKKKLNDIDALDSKRESVTQRLLKAQELTDQQLDLRAQAEMPSKNAVHSKYKNGLINEINRLEQDKIAILRSIVDDGFDPTITTLDTDGNRQELPLSHFVGAAEKRQREENGEKEVAPKNDVKRVGRFTVLKGGKDDNTSH